MVYSKIYIGKDILNEMGKKGQMSITAIAFSAVIALILFGAFFFIMAEFLNQDNFAEEGKETTTILSDDNVENTVSPSIRSVSSVTTPANVSLAFDGVNDRVRNSTYFTNNNTDVTYAGWFKLADDVHPDDANTYSIIESGYFYMHIRNFSATNDCNGVTFRYSDGVSARTSSTPCAPNSPEEQVALGDRNWHFVVGKFWRDGATNNTAMYIDGLRVDLDSHLGGPLASASADTVSGERGGLYFNGSLDDISITHSALTSGAIAQMYYNSARKEYDTVIPILMYHRYLSSGQPTSELQVNQSMLEEQMNYLNNSGFESVTFNEVYDALVAGTSTLPEKPFIMVWDDAAVAQWYNATVEVLDKYGYYGDMALNPSSVVEVGVNNWSTVNDLIQNYSWGISSHSYEHCHNGFGVGGSAPTWCNSTETRRGNMSAAKQNITAKTGIVPRAHVFPYNDWGNQNATDSWSYGKFPEVMEDCFDFFDICTGSASQFGAIDGPTYSVASSYSNVQSMKNGSIARIQISNDTDLAYINDVLNYTIPNKSLHWRYNENQGTVAHDGSGNNRNGAVDGAAWQNDSSTVALMNSVDYRTTTNSFTILNPEYAWSLITLSYTTNSESGQGLASIISNLVNIPTFVGLIILVGIVVLIIVMLRRDGVGA